LEEKRARVRVAIQLDIFFSRPSDAGGDWVHKPTGWNVSRLFRFIDDDA
jgi:hypothetical protein